MNTQQEPTNAEIYEKLGNMESRLDAILIQVKETNGRVTKLERWKDKLDTIAEYTKENKDGERVVDWQKLLLYALGLVGTALAIISFLVGKR